MYDLRVLHDQTRGSSRRALLRCGLYCAGWLAITSLTACTKLSERAELQVSVVADSRVREQLVDLVTVVEVQAPGGGWRPKDEQRFDVSPETQWPVGFVLAETLEDAYGVYRLTATGRDRQGAIVAQARAIREFRKGSKLVLSLWFEESCMFRMPLCSAVRTCHDNQCVDATDSFMPGPLAADGGMPENTPSGISSGVLEDMPCSTAGARSCAGIASRQPLQCDGTAWRQQPVCQENERCSSAPGDTQGSCQPVATDCAQRVPDVTFCKDDLMLVCKDLLKTEERPCGQDEHCITTGTGARCDCLTGFRRDGARCQAVTDCNSSSCDELTICNRVDAKPVCTACPEGFAGSGETGCQPRLTGIALEVGVLTPSFDPQVREYRVEVPFVTASLSVGFSWPQHSRVEVNGERVAEGAAWRSPVLSAVEVPVQVSVISESGATATYRLILDRAGKQEAFAKAHVPGSGDVFGLSVGLFKDTLVVGAVYEDSSATTVNGEANEASSDSGAAYVYSRHGGTWQQDAYLKPTDTSPQDYFGTSVAIWEDTIVVGATHDDVINLATTPTRSGVVYVFVRKQGDWVFQQRLTPSSGNPGDLFGYHVALEGDTLVVAAAADGGAGAAYVYTRSGDTWTEQQKLKPSKPQTNAMFGSNVAVFADTIAVGAQNDATGARDGGAAYVFVKRGGSWAEQQQILPSSPQASASFGYVLALYGERLIVGAPRVASILSFAQVASGEAFVFERSGERWAETQQLKAAVARTSDSFGASVGITANAIVVGAGGDASGGGGLYADPTSEAAPYTGAAYLFALDRGMWRPTAFVKAERPESNATFGFASAITDDTLVVSAPFDGSGARGVNAPSPSSGLASSGAVYVFR